MQQVTCTAPGVYLIHEEGQLSRLRVWPSGEVRRRRRVGVFRQCGYFDATPSATHIKT